MNARLINLMAKNTKRKLASDKRITLHKLRFSFLASLFSDGIATLKMITIIVQQFVFLLVVGVWTTENKGIIAA